MFRVIYPGSWRVEDLTPVPGIAGLECPATTRRRPLETAQELDWTPHPSEAIGHEKPSICRVIVVTTTTAWAILGSNSPPEITSGT